MSNLMLKRVQRYSKQAIKCNTSIISIRVIISCRRFTKIFCANIKMTRHLRLSIFYRNTLYSCKVKGQIPYEYCLQAA